MVWRREPRGQEVPTPLSRSAADGAVPASAITAGWVRAGGNLTQLVVANAGRMAPADAPEACYDMLQRFLTDAPFA